MNMTSYETHLPAHQPFAYVFKRHKGTDDGPIHAPFLNLGFRDRSLGQGFPSAKTWQEECKPCTREDEKHTFMFMSGEVVMMARSTYLSK